MMGGIVAHYDGIKAFSETDQTEDLKSDQAKNQRISLLPFTLPLYFTPFSTINISPPLPSFILESTPMTLPSKSGVMASSEVWPTTICFDSKKASISSRFLLETENSIK